MSRFVDTARTATAPAQGAMAVSPSNTVDMAEPIRALTIGTAGGTLSFVGRDGATYTTGPLPVGTYALEAVRIRVTGTTATGLTGWI